jgi:hypothetical protein
MPEFNATDLVITIKFNSSLDSEKGTPREGTKYPYEAEVTYASVKDTVEKASKFTGWALQRRARAGELPTGKLIKVNGEGEYQKTLDDQVTEMDEDKAMELFLKLQAKLQAKIAAEKPAKK